MESFAYIESEFLDVLKKHQLSTKKDFVNFFIVYYEFTTGGEEYDNLFKTIQEHQNFLYSAMDEACASFGVDYDADYDRLSDLELKQLWWFLQITLAGEIFKSTKPMYTQNAVANLKTRLPQLNEKALQLEMVFLTVLLEETPFAPRPIFNNWYGETVFKDKKAWFLNFCQQNEDLFSVKKMKNGLFLPYELSSNFCTDAELFFDIYIVSLFEILKVISEQNKEVILGLYVDEFFKNTCIQRRVKKIHKDELLKNTIELADYLLEENDEEDEAQ